MHYLEFSHSNRLDMSVCYLSVPSINPFIHPPIYHTYTVFSNDLFWLLPQIIPQLCVTCSFSSLS